jgi:hypothetical protein
MKIRLCIAQLKIKIIFKINKYHQVFKKVIMRMSSQSTRLINKILFTFKNQMLKERIIKKAL